MSSIASIRASNKSVLSSLSTPTAVFVGGTSGIGRAMAERFALHTDGQANIVIVGRNEQAAKEIISSFPPPQPPLKHEFIACDVTSMKAAGEAAARIRSSFPTIDFLVLTPGYASMDGREETSEGLDKKMAVNYYGRWKFVYDLADKLNPGRGGKVLTVLGAGHGAKVDIDDLPIRNGYSVSKVAVVTPTYNDLAMESFAKLYPKHSFIHAFPGVVRTPYLANSKTHLIRWTAPVVMGLSYPFSFSSEENAEYMWHGMLSAKAGALRMGSKGEDIGKKNYFGSEEERESLWKHTVEAVNRK